MKTTWDELRRWLGDEWRATDAPAAAAPTLAAMSTDTRTIRAGDWFVPISGESFDGHKFIGDAVARGATGFFYAAERAGELAPALLAKGVAVGEPLAAFQKAASGWRQALRGVRIGALTGSTGKTTTKEMVGAILRQAGATLATQASFNNEVGVPKTLAMLTPEHRYAVVEMGARHKGNIRFLCDLVRPDVACLLNVGVAHLGEFGSPEALLHTKLEIFRDSPPDAICVASADDARISDGARATGKQVVTFGRAKHADVRLLEDAWSADGTMALALMTPAGRIEARLGVAHEAFAGNAAAAAAMALAAGAEARHIAAGLTGFTGIKGRYQVHVRGGLTVIDDTYNANPDSMRAGISTLARAYGARRKVLVLGDMLELGPTSSDEHRKVGAMAMRLARPELLVAIGPSAELIMDGARQEGLARERMMTFANVDQLVAAHVAFGEHGDVVYAKASNGIKLSKLIDALLGAKP